MKAFILSTCSTCQRIIKEISWNGEIQDIKSQHIDAKTLDKLAKQHGSYEALFNKRAMKYRSLELNKQNLTENDYRDWILKEYTFLKRPVFIIGDSSFAGNSKKVVESIKAALYDK